MTEKEAKAFEKQLINGIKELTATIHDEPRYQLTGELIPDDVLHPAEGPSCKKSAAAAPIRAGSEE